MKLGFRELIVYKKAFSLSLNITKASSEFPIEEKFALTDQIRRSSRSVCSNIGESYRKRQYIAHFISKLSDADMENTETQIGWILLWPIISFQRKYIMILLNAQKKLVKC